jgi:hypothetical protein
MLGLHRSMTFAPSQRTLDSHPSTSTLTIRMRCARETAAKAIGWALEEINLARMLAQTGEIRGHIRHILAQRLEREKVRRVRFERMHCAILPARGLEKLRHGIPVRGADVDEDIVLADGQAGLAGEIGARPRTRQGRRNSATPGQSAVHVRRRCQCGRQ